MAILDHGHIFQSDNRPKPSDRVCMVQFALFWVGFFILTYLGSVLIGLIVG